MRGKTHLKSVVTPAFLAAMVLSAATSNLALGANYQAIDLNPSGYSSSMALGTNGTQQVGNGYGSATGGNQHALLWSSSEDNVIDLNQFLPAGFGGISYATAIDGYGNIVGYAQQGSSGNYHAILWQPIPEPATLFLLGLGGLALLRKRRAQVKLVLLDNGL